VFGVATIINRTWMAMKIQSLKAKSEVVMEKRAKL
jgi:hypothetical protein